MGAVLRASNKPRAAVAEGDDGAALGNGDMPHSLKVPGILDDAIVRFAMRTGAMLGRVERDKKLIAVLALDDVCDGHAVRKAGQVTDLGMLGVFRCHWISSLSCLLGL